jgi:hypothetical protein
LSAPGTAFQGDWGAKVVAPGAITYLRSVMQIPTVQNEQFYAECYVKNASSGTAGAKVMIRGVDAAGAEVWTVSGNVVTGNAYALSSVSGTVPAGVKKVHVQIASAVGTGTVYADLVRMFRKNNALLIVDGAIQANHMGANSIAVGTAAIQNGAIVNAMIGNLAVDTANIVNGAIVNAKIGNLAVDTANIAAAAITNAKLGTAAVDTLQIAGNAVTVPVVSFYGIPGSLFTVTTTPAIAVSAALTVPSGTSILVTISSVAVVANNGLASSTFYVYHEILRDSTVIWYGYSNGVESVVNWGTKNSDEPFCASVMDSAPDASAHTYKYRVSYLGTVPAGASVSLENPVIVAVAAKR